MRSAFRKRKMGMPLDPIEREAERQYDAQRRRVRVQVYLDSPGEVREWKKRAKAAGFSSVGMWIASVCRQGLAAQERVRSELADAKRRADEAEAQVAFLERKVRLLQSALQGVESET